MAKRTETPPANDTDTDRFPTFSKALSRAAADHSHGSTPVRRIDIRFGAAGDGVYRVWYGRDEEWTAGVIPPEGSSA